MAAKVRAYLATERHGCVWVWTGRRNDADPAVIPDFRRLTDARYPRAIASLAKFDATERWYRRKFSS